MTVSTTSAAIHITPVVLKTLYRHAKKKGTKFKDSDSTVTATDDIFFDEAFHIVKAFIDMGIHNSIESLQAFTNTHVPAPYWAAVSPVLVPFQSCNRAADLLIEWFGPNDLKTAVGGGKWWQVRGLDGVDSEWITEKEYLSEIPARNGKHRKLSTEDENILRMEHLDTVMLYVHGGAYFWGSINTHRYQIIRYARKFKGRVFAVNYRKAPQYPWPCPLQDVLAAYLYLTSPPEGVLHKPIPPSKIVLAGDSAGAGLCITLLTILRDLGIEQPAGAVLISPWVDLTHSFPSVMKNTATDIIPPYGFIHKPSPIWPVDPLPKQGDARVVQAQTNPPPFPGHTDTLRPSKSRFVKQVVDRAIQGAEQGQEKPISAGQLKEDNVKSQEGMMSMGSGTDVNDVDNNHNCSALKEKFKKEDDNKKANLSADDSNTIGGRPNDDNPLTWKDAKHIMEDDLRYDEVIAFWEPKPPKVFMENPDDVPLELHSQIQMYATNEQLTHPLVSPVVQGSLGNLCPLYIIAGNGEVLRDEIIYLAHKAAHPKDYPTRRGVLQEGRRQRENAEKFTKPTKVHLQVYDDMCHVLTVFTFTDAAKYAYRSIAEFVKHVTHNSAEHLERNPFPELHRPFPDMSESGSESDGENDRPHIAIHASSSGVATTRSKEEKGSASLPVHSQVKREEVELFKANTEKAEIEIAEGTAERSESNGRTPEVSPSKSASSSGSSTPNGDAGKNENHETSEKITAEQDISGVFMIRERVDIFGRVRPMEPREQIEALNIPPRLIGIIKEEPVRRWLAGQEMWDKRYVQTAHKVERQRKHYEQKYATVMEHVRAQGLELHKDATRAGLASDRRASAVSNRRRSVSSVGEIISEKRYGPFDVQDEAPSPTAIVGRRDNRESVALVKKSVYFSAPVTHRNIPQRSTGDAVRAAFDPEDNPMKPPKQSVSEQQTEAHMVPMHGLRIWQNLVSYFMKKSSKKAIDGKRRAESAIHSASEHIQSRSRHSSS